MHSLEAAHPHPGRAPGDSSGNSSSGQELEGDQLATLVFEVRLGCLFWWEPQARVSKCRLSYSCTARGLQGII